MEKAKYQREIEEMKQKLSKLPTSPSPLEVTAPSYKAFRTLPTAPSQLKTVPSPLEVT